jgi:hypothetical protein
MGDVLLYHRRFQPVAMRTSMMVEYMEPAVTIVVVADSLFRQRPQKVLRTTKMMIYLRSEQARSNRFGVT